MRLVECQCWNVPPLSTQKQDSGTDIRLKNDDIRLMRLEVRLGTSYLERGDRTEREMETSCVCVKGGSYFPCTLNL